MTTMQYLNDLINQRDILAQNLNTMGVFANNTEKFNTLVSKVLEIPQTSTDKKGVAVLSTVQDNYLGWGPADVIKEVYIPDGITQINGPFQYCANMTTLYIPSSVTSIGAYAFQSCTLLENLSVGVGFSADLTVSASNVISVNSLSGVIQNLADLSTSGSTKTLTIGDTNIAKLSEDDIALAISKNWTLS